MCIEEGFSLKEPWVTYQSRQTTRACKQIPESQRQELAFKIQARAVMLGGANPEALKKAMNILTPSTKKEGKTNE